MLGRMLVKDLAWFVRVGGGTDAAGIRSRGCRFAIGLVTCFCRRSTM